MVKKEIFRKIGGILEEITEQYKYLSEDIDNLNELELELFIANAHFLSEHLVILQKLKVSSLKNSQSIANKLAEVKEVTENVDERAKIPVESHFSNVNDHTKVFEFDNQPIEQLLDQSLTLDELQTLNDNSDGDEIVADHELATERNLEESKPFETVVNEVTLSERTIAIPRESFLNGETNASAPTINDLLSEKISQNTLANQFNQQPVKDLKSIISLNDKLLFVKDLFKGYSLAYNEAIDFLNRCEKIEEADVFLKKNYAVKNNWLEKEASVEKFYEILNRRFI